MYNSHYVLYFHAITGVLIFILSIILMAISNFNNRLKRLALVNMFLILFTGIIGIGFLLIKFNFYSIYAPYIHYLLAIGILSNYAVMLGIFRTLN